MWVKMASISLEWLYRNRLVPHITKNQVTEKTYLHTHLLTWKPLVSLHLIFTGTTTNNTKLKLQGLNIVSVLLSPGQWAVKLLHGELTAWRERMRLAALENRKLTDLLSLVFADLMLDFECPHSFVFSHPIRGDPSITTIMSWFVLKSTIGKWNWFSLPKT